LDGVGNLDVLRRIADEGLINRYVFFHVETLGLKAHYAELGFEFPVILGPLERRLEASSKPSRPDTQKPVLAYLGKARDEKGFERVPDILEALADQDALRALHVRIQIYSNPSNDTPEIRAAKHRLRDLQAAGHDIVLLDALSPKEFNAELHAAEVVLIPYWVSAYQARGSGMVYDALTFGTKVVYTLGTDITLTFADYGVYVPAGCEADEFGYTVRVAVFYTHHSDNAGLEPFEIPQFFEILFATH